MIPGSSDYVRAKGGRRRGLSCALIIDDHPIVLQGCRQLLEDAGIGRVFEAQTVAEGFELYRVHRPDVIIIDLTLGASELAGLSFINRLRLEDKRTPVLVFTMHSDEVIVRRTLSLGATGYVLKDGPFDELLKAFARVRRGKSYVSEELASNEERNPNPLDALTPRELQILALLAEGKSYRNIARHLRMSASTVATTCRSIKSKLGIDSLPELMRLTIRYLPSARLSPELSCQGPIAGLAKFS